MGRNELYKVTMSVLTLLALSFAACSNPAGDINLNEEEYLVEYSRTWDNISFTWKIAQASEIEAAPGDKYELFVIIKDKELISSGIISEKSYLYSNQPSYVESPAFTTGISGSVLSRIFGLITFDNGETMYVNYPRSGTGGSGGSGGGSGGDNGTGNGSNGGGNGSDGVGDGTDSDSSTGDSDGSNGGNNGNGGGVKPALPPDSGTLDSIEEVENSLVEGDEPVDLVIGFDLEDMTDPDSNWQKLLYAIGDAGKQVNLDLSAATMNVQGPEFDPATSPATGKDKIVSIILPDEAEGIVDHVFFAGKKYPFSNFDTLVRVAGQNIETIGVAAFSGRNSLQEVYFPAATDIRDWAFYECSSLQEIDFPVAEIIGDFTFGVCTTLQKVNLPAATHIREAAFVSTALQEVNLPVATYIGGQVFSNCTALQKVNLPAVTEIDIGAFNYCTALQEVNLPVVTKIGIEAFAYCSALQIVSLPSVTHIDEFAFANAAVQEVILPSVIDIGNYAFGSTENKPFTIILGHSAPTLGYRLTALPEQAITDITVKFPAGAIGYGVLPDKDDVTTSCWGNGLRGGGWDGLGLIELSQVTAFNLTFQMY